MRNSSVVLPLALSVLVWASPARATTVTFEAFLDGTNEVPLNASLGTGHGIFVFDDQGTVAIGDDTLSVDVTFANLFGFTTAAHIHAPAPPGVNAPVVIGFTGFPVSVQSGTYLNIFNLGTLGAGEAAFEANLFAGLSYVNIHTQIFPGGEIRDQLVIAAVPEPTSMLLLGSGLLAAGVRRWRRR